MLEYQFVTNHLDIIMQSLTSHSVNCIRFGVYKCEMHQPPPICHSQAQDIRLFSPSDLCQNWFMIFLSQLNGSQLDWEDTSNTVNACTVVDNVVSGDEQFGPLSALISSIDKTQFNPFVQKVDRKIVFHSFYSPFVRFRWIWCIAYFLTCGCISYMCACVQKSLNRSIIEWIFIYAAVFCVWILFLFFFFSLCSKDGQTLFNFESCIQST